ncbi:monovalent cation/H+ antiporter complex subunit F [Actinotalea sp.]|uniref:monovalent cation/H+ antiporter complex subunit F n=1 Tax=Actinotalea sp. TaxID=1872145 RepID=UPI0035693633
MTVVLIFCGVLLVTGAVLVLVRLQRGPTMLDRTIALDAFTAILIGAFVLIAVATRRRDIVPILAVLSLVGFVGSVTIARFAAVEPEGEGRILTREEVAALERERLAAEDAELAASDDEHHGGPAQGEVTG